MGLFDFLGSKTSRRLSVLSTLADAALALYRGRTRTALLLAVAAVLAYRWSFVGAVASVAVRLAKR